MAATARLAEALAEAVGLAAPLHFTIPSGSRYDQQMPPSPSAQRFGAWPDTGGTRFRVWAPAAREVWLTLERPDEADEERVLTPGADGAFEGWMPDVGPGTRYWYRLDGGPHLPDPASRFQPDGVHGPSEVVDPDAFEWSDQAWAGTTLARASIYELHVGTFSPEGTFNGVRDRLPHLRDLGVTAVELMPVADFAGRHNWGYDGVCLFAPARCYGRPDDLRHLVNTAHRLGLAVLLDVVYNHLGPDGAYMGTFAPAYFSDRHQSPWGQAINLDGQGSAMARAWIVDNARHWAREYHVDGLRLDATHALVDESGTHLVADLAAGVHEADGARRLLVVAEDERNLAVMVRPTAEGGWGLDGVWADDFHHRMRRLLAGDADGYFADFSATTADLAATIRQGWFFTGQHSTYLDRPRGTDPAGIPRERFVVCLQNHDQVGNRAFGDRLHHQIDPAAYRAALAVLLMAPETPLIFMGQEWAADSPFLYFTDHNEALGRLVTEGRRREFGRFAAFADPAVRARIPDPQALATFEASRLDWSERAAGTHAAVERLTRALLTLRRHEPAFEPGRPFDAAAPDTSTVALTFGSLASPDLMVVARLGGAGEVPIGATSRRPAVALSTEDAAYAIDPRPPAIETSHGAWVARFDRPAALVIKWS
jgi:maltooligosyltrehalose trehalohydrolase